MITTGFKEDLQYFQNLLSTKTPFSLVRFGDGEMDIMKGHGIDLLHKGEFKFAGEAHLRLDLIKSFQHEQENYHVGIACPCCVGQQNFDWMKKNTYLDDSCLTWANIFVNSNYRNFKEQIVPLFEDYEITLVSPGDISNLPSNINKHYSIGKNAWVNNADVYGEIRNQILESDDTNPKLFLFCAGPFANILCHKLFSEFPNHTFIDLGSVWNAELGIGKNRGYLRGAPTLQKVCIWG